MRHRMLLCFSIMLFIPNALSLHFAYSLADQLAPNSSTPATISSAYPLNGTTGVRVPLQWSFSIGLLTETCVGEGADPIGYSAQGLPDWLQFDPLHLDFYGDAPDNNAEVTAVLTCSQSADKSTQSFQVQVIGQLSINSSLPNIRATQGQAMSYRVEDIASKLTIDKSKLTANQVAALSMEAGTGYGWLTWDLSSRSLVGTVDNALVDGLNATTLSIPVTVSLPGVLPLQTSFQVTVQPSAFVNLPISDRKISQTFELSIAQWLRSPTIPIDMSLDPTAATQWMSYDPTTMSLHGTVPANISYPSVAVLLTATDRQGQTSSASFKLVLGDQDAGLSFLPPFPSTRRVLVISIIVIALALILLGFVSWTLFRRCITKPNATNIETRHLKPAVSGRDLAEFGEKLDTQYREGDQPSQLPVSLPTPTLPQRPAVLMRTASHDSAGSPPLVTAAGVRLLQRSRALSGSSTTTPNSTFPSARDDRPFSDAQSIQEIPRPPPGLSPEELQEWVDNYVCDWYKEYKEKKAGDVSRNIGTSYSSGSGGVETIRMPLAKRARINAANRSSSASFPFSGFPGKIHRRSASNPEGAKDSPARSAGTQTYMSSVASWDSLDTWEMDRRIFYESPRRRSDFAAPGEPAIRPRELPLNASYVQHGSNQGLTKENVLGIHPVHYPRYPVISGLATSNSAGTTLNGLAELDPHFSGSHSGSPITSDPSTVPSSAKLVSHIVDDDFIPTGEFDLQDWMDQEVVFFDRPLGKETPGSGLARSPLLGQLSRFGTPRLE